MRLKALFYRFLVASAGFFLPLVALAVAAPFLINAEPVKDRLIQELRSWTGSHVELNGPVAIESFFSLSLNAQNVEFFAFKGVPELKTLKAEEIVARIAWMDLFAGRLDFDKIKIINSKANLAPIGRDELLASVEAMLNVSQNAQFDAFVLQNSQISIAGFGDIPPRSIGLPNLIVSLDDEDRTVELKGNFSETGETASIITRLQSASGAGANGSPALAFQIDSPSLTASFDGAVRFAPDWKAQGAISATVNNPGSLKNWLGDWALTEIESPVVLAGSIDATPSHVRFENGSVSLAGQTATGDFDLRFRGGGAFKLQGAAAFNELDVTALSAVATGEGADPDAGGAFWDHMLAKGRLDLRLSADSLVFGGTKLGNAAFTLVGDGQRFSSEIAHVELFGGSIIGHAQIDMQKKSPGFRARLTAENLDVAQLQAGFTKAGWLSGRLDGGIEIKASGRSIEALLRTAQASGKASMTDGGQIRLDIAQLASIAGGAGQDGWGETNRTWSDFETLRFAYTFNDDVLRVQNVMLTRADDAVSAFGRIDVAKKDLQLGLTFLPAAQDNAAEAGAKLVIRGVWSHPAFRSVAQANRAEKEPFDDGLTAEAGNRF